jgi:hypothetical protein
LVVGNLYTVTARPAAGFLFSNWTVSSALNTPITNQVLSFLMANGLVLEANFIPNPFPAVAGSYAGLFGDTNNPSFTTSRFFTATITPVGAMSAQLQLAGKKYSFSGQFSPSGVFSNSISRGSTMSRLTVQLQLDLTTGTLLTGQVSDPTFNVPLLAERNVFSRSQPFPSGGKKYTMVIPGSPVSLVEPGGNGFGTVAVDQAGTVRFAGTLGDGTKVSQSTFVSSQGQWPLFASLYSSRGSIQGWMTFTNLPDRDLTGGIDWFKLGKAGIKIYGGGFTFATEGIGSLYSIASGGPVLNLSQGQLVLANGGLTQDLTNLFLLGANNRVVNQGPNRMNLSFSPSSGLFQGSMANPANHNKSIAFSGAVLQKQTNGFGLFLTTNQAGGVFLSPRP